MQIEVSKHCVERFYKRFKDANIVESWMRAIRIDSAAKLLLLGLHPEPKVYHYYDKVIGAIYLVKPSLLPGIFVAITVFKSREGWHTRAKLEHRIFKNKYGRRRVFLHNKTHVSSFSTSS